MSHEGEKLGWPLEGKLKMEDLKKYILHQNFFAITNVFWFLLTPSTVKVLLLVGTNSCGFYKIHWSIGSSWFLQIHWSIGSSWFLQNSVIHRFIVVSNVTGNNQWGNCISLDFYFPGLRGPRNPRKLEPPRVIMISECHKCSSVFCVNTTSHHKISSTFCVDIRSSDSLPGIRSLNSAYNLPTDSDKPTCPIYLLLHISL